MTRSYRMLAVALVAGVLPSSRVMGQDFPRLNPSWEFGVSSRYVWRGITRDRGPIVNAQAGLTRSSKAVDLTIAGWSSFVSDDCGHCRQVLGLTAAELNASFTTTWHTLLKPVDVTTGIAVYSASPAPWDPLEARGTTAEVLLAVTSRPSRHALISLSGWLDIAEVKGTYFEGALTIPLTLKQGTNARAFLTGTLGINGGQLREPGEPGYFAETGPAFAAVQVNVIPIATVDPCKYRGSLQVYVRLQGNFDPLTKERRPGEGRPKEQRIWLGMSWLGAMGKTVPPEWCRTPK